MASLYVTEYQGIGQVDPGGAEGTSFFATAQAPKGPSLVEQKLTISGVSTQSAAFNRFTKLVRLHTDVVCSISIGGANPAATTSSARLAANQTEYFSVDPGDKVAVITNA